MTSGQISERMTKFEDVVFQKLDSFAGIGGAGVRDLARHADPRFNAAHTSFLLFLFFSRLTLPEKCRYDFNVPFSLLTYFSIQLFKYMCVYVRVYFRTCVIIVYA